MNGFFGHIAAIRSQMHGPALTIFFVCLIAWTLTNLDQSLFGYLIPGIRAEFGVDLNTVGWILSVSFGFSVLSAIAIGVLADRYGRKIMFIVSLGASAFLVGLQGFATDVFSLGVLRALSFGMSNGMAALVITYTSEAAPPRYRGLITGFLGVGYPLGWFVASLGAAPLMTAYGWRVTFFLAFAVVPLALILFRFLPESGRFIAARDEAPRDHWTTQIKLLFAPGLRRRTVLCIFSMFAFGGAYAGTAFFFPTFYIEVRGYSEVEATSIVGMSYFIGLGGYFGSAIVGEFYTTRRNTVTLWYWLGALGLLGVVWLPETRGEDILWFGIMATFFYGSQAVLGVFISELFPTRVRATGSALAGTGGLYAGFAVFPVVVTYAVESIGWQWAFTVIAAPLLLVAGALLLGIENIKSGIDLEAASDVRPSHQS
ncbi:MAG: MFS transporter [Alphaproteobacteria bacterium]|nr:MFS transporter [Alphaproteobacteria bacterium]